MWETPGPASHSRTPGPSPGLAAEHHVVKCPAASTQPLAIPVSWPPARPVPKSTIQPVDCPLPGDFQGQVPRSLAAALELAQVLVKNLPGAQG